MARLLRKQVPVLIFKNQETSGICTFGKRRADLLVWLVWHWYIQYEGAQTNKKNSPLWRLLGPPMCLMVSLVAGAGGILHHQGGVSDPGSVSTSSQLHDSAHSQNSDELHYRATALIPYFQLPSVSTEIMPNSPSSGP